MSNDGDHSAGDRWARTVVGEIRRFKSLRPRRGRVLRYTPMPPEVRASVNKSLACWPLPQSNRDEAVVLVAQRISGAQGPAQRPHGFIPEPEASRVAAAAEAEGFAAASAYAAGKALDTDEERADVSRRYVREVWSSAYRYAESRSQAAAGTSRAGPAAQPPPPVASSSGAGVSGPVQQLGMPSASAPPPPAAPEE